MRLPSVQTVFVLKAAFVRSNSHHDDNGVALSYAIDIHQCLDRETLAVCGLRNRDFDVKPRRVAALKLVELKRVGLNYHAWLNWMQHDDAVMCGCVARIGQLHAYMVVSDDDE